MVLRDVLFFEQSRSADRIASSLGATPSALAQTPGDRCVLQKSTNLRLSDLVVPLHAAPSSTAVAAIVSIRGMS